MSDAGDQLEEVGEVVQQLTKLGLEPILVGGMALVTLGSRRVTRDFDFVIAKPDARLEAVLDVFYGLRIDLWFDFPVPASTLLQRATRRKVRSHVFRIASEEDLLRLKKMAKAHRSVPADIEDIAFLEARRK